MRRALLSTAIFVASCSPSGGTVPPAALGDDAYCALAATEGLVILRAGVATRCGLERGEHAEGGASACEHSRIAADGALVPLDLVDATDALLASDGTLVVRYADGQLTHRRADGSEAVLADWASDPSLVGDRLAYVAAPSDALIEDGEPAPGTPLDVVLRTVGQGPVVLTTDETAASPFALPNGGVVYTSTRTGLASLFRAAPGSTPVQLTNVGLETAGQGFVPVPDRELVFVPGTERAVFTAHYDDDRIWIVDLVDGDAEELGPGRLPQLDGSSVRVATPGAATATCARRIPLGDRP